MRVYFDASIIIAALLSPAGGSKLLFQFINKGIIHGVTSQTVIDEILEADKPKKIKKSFEDIKMFISESKLLIGEEITEELIAPYIGKIDSEDAHLIAGAKHTKCEYLVTLDRKHLLREDIKEYFLPLKIVDPKELIEKIVRD